MKPVHREQLLELVDTFLKHMSAIWNGEKHLFKRTSAQAVKCEKQAKLVAPSDMSVLILGENGTGKESVARMIHNYSDRHELDEIGTLPYSVQSVLLRVLQENTYIPVGDSKERHADVRIVAATNEDIPKAIAERRFREDLYHRLGEFEITQPPLRQCPEDILPLATKLRRDTEGFSIEAQQLLLSYEWPGNIRELQNKIKRAVLLTEKPVIEPECMDIGINTNTVSANSVYYDGMTEEKLSIIKALKATGGHRKKTAELLGINPATLYRKMNKYGLK